MRRIATTLLVVLGVAGCRPSVAGICESLEDGCGVYGDCEEEGEALEQSSESAGCGDAFDAYLECLDDAGCGWRQSCVNERAALEACAGPLKP